jgi:hypothetical protein
MNSGITKIKDKETVKMRYLFASIDNVDRDYLAGLMDNIGIEVFLGDEYLIHNTGFSLPDDLLDSHPYKDWARCRRRVKRHLRANELPDHAYPQFPGIPDSFSDEKFYKTRRLCDELGLQLYAHASLFGEAGDVLPAFGTREVDDDIPDEKSIMFGIPLCPNNDTLTEWTAKGLGHVAANYPIDGFDFDHAHFTSIAATDTLFLCSCPCCRTKAAQMGFDFDDMLMAARQLKDKMAGMDPVECRRYLADADTLLDFFELLAGKPIVSWFQFRVLSTMRYMEKMVRAIRINSPKAIKVNCQLAPPTMAFMCGQSISDLSAIVDVVTPGWGHWVGWEHSLALAVASLSACFLQGTSGLEERYVVRQIARLTGFEASRTPEIVLDFKNRVGYSRAEVVRKQYEFAMSRVSKGGVVVPPLLVEAPVEEEFSQCALMLERSRKSFVYGRGIDTKEDAARVGL